MVTDHGGTCLTALPQHVIAGARACIVSNHNCTYHGAQFFHEGNNTQGRVKGWDDSNRIRFHDFESRGPRILAPP